MFEIQKAQVHQSVKKTFEMYRIVKELTPKKLMMIIEMLQRGLIKMESLDPTIQKVIRRMSMKMEMAEKPQTDLGILLSHTMKSKKKHHKKKKKKETDMGILMGSKTYKKRLKK